MKTEAHIPEYPTELTLIQWLLKAIRLPWGEVLGRTFRLCKSTTINLYVISKYKREVDKKKRHVCAVILTDRLGDIIAGHSAVSNLVKPNQDILWLVRKQFTEILEFNSNVQKIIPVSSYTETIILRWFLKSITWKSLQIDGALCNMFGFAVKNPNVNSINNKNYYNFGSLVDVYSLISEKKTANERPKVYQDPRFNPLKFLENIFLYPKNPLLIIHPASDEIARSWPKSKCHELIEWILENTKFNIIELGLTPVLIEGERVKLIRRTLRLGQQASIMSHADFFIGVDSGFAHLANSFEVPSLLLIGHYHQFSDHMPWRIKEDDVVLRAPHQVITLTRTEVQNTLLKMLEDKKFLMSNKASETALK